MSIIESKCMCWVGWTIVLISSALCLLFAALDWRFWMEYRVGLGSSLSRAGCDA